MILIRLVLWLIILGVFASPVIAWYGLDDKPLVTKSADIRVGDINSAKAFLQQYARLHLLSLFLLLLLLPILLLRLLLL